MGKLIVVVVIIAALAYAWQQGWIAQWFNTAVDSSVDSVKRTQRDATKVRQADPAAAPAEKK
jgi:hypothetical protein